MLTATLVFVALLGQKSPLAGDLQVSDIEYTVTVSDAYNRIVVNKRKVETKGTLPCQINTKLQLQDEDREPMLLVLTPTLRRGDMMEGAFSVVLADGKPFAWSKRFQRKKRIAFLLHKGEPRRDEHWDLRSDEKPILEHGQYLIEIWADVVRREEPQKQQAAGGLPAWPPAFLLPPYTYRQVHASFTLKDSQGKVISNPSIVVIDKCAINVNFGQTGDYQLYWQMLPLLNPDGSVTEFYKEAFSKQGYSGAPVNSWEQKAHVGQVSRFVVTRDPDKVRPVSDGEELKLKPDEYVVEVTVSL